MNKKIPLPVSERYFVMADLNENHNKFYHMIPDSPSPGQFTVRYGRVGDRCPTCYVYPIHDWDRVYCARIAHKYIDISDVYFAKKANEVDNLAVKEDSRKETMVSETEKLMKSLYNYMKKFIKTNYNVDRNHITNNMVVRADSLLLELSKEKDCVKHFNEILCEILMVVPRVMNDTTVMGARSKDDFDHIVKREADYLDTIRGIAVSDVKDNKISTKSDDDCVIINDINNANLEFTECRNTNEIEKIKSLMGEENRRFVRAWSINSKRTSSFEQWKEKHGGKVLTLFHGTKNENLYSIMNQGLVTNPNAQITGKAFGDGIYFGKACKSVNYTSINGSYWARGNQSTAYLLVCDVAMGSMFECDGYTDEFNKRGFHTKYDSLHAKGGNGLRRDEWIVYSNNQVRIRYLVESAS